MNMNRKVANAQVDLRDAEGLEKLANFLLTRVKALREDALEIMEDAKDAVGEATVTLLLSSDVPEQPVTWIEALWALETLWPEFEQLVKDEQKEKMLQNMANSPDLKNFTFYFYGRQPDSQSDSQL